MAENFGVYDINGKYETYVTSSLYNALQPLSGNINIRRLPERILYNKLLLGSASRSDVAEVPLDSSSATVPSWTQINIGKKYAFVISELSSSDHMVDVENTYVSGVFAIENTAVPASASWYYTKQQRFIKRIYKLSASNGMSIIPGNERDPSTIENVSRYVYDSVSGSYRNNSYFDPAIFEIDVSEYGKIRDVKVWVELVHDVRSGTGIINTGSVWGGMGDVNANKRQGLQGLQIALRSPNTNFKYAHPLWNDPILHDRKKDLNHNIPERYQDVPELLRNSYLLWAGHAVEQDLGQTLGSFTGSFEDEIWEGEIISSSSLIQPLQDVRARPITCECDKENRIHAVIATTGSLDYLYYGFFGSNGWSFTPIISSALPETDIFKFANTKLKLNDSNQPRILLDRCFYDLVGDDRIFNSNIQYYYSNDNSVTWSCERVAILTASVPATPISYMHIGFSDMVLSNDTPHVAYFTDTDVKYAKRVGTNDWKHERIISTKLNQYQTFVGITIDSNDEPHVIFSSADRYLYHGHSGSNGWSVEQLPFDISTNLGCVQCVVDDDNVLHVVSRYDKVEGSIYFDQLNPGRIVYFKSGSDGWLSSSLYEPTRNYTFGGNAQIYLNKKTRAPSITFAKGDMITTKVFDPTITLVDIHPYGILKKTVFIATSSAEENSPWKSHVAGTTDYLGNHHIMFFSGTANPDYYLSYFREKGAILDEDTGYRIVRHTISSSLYHSFNTDIDMRTIFTDSSHNLNPRHTKILYQDSENRFPTFKLLDSNSYHSPSSGAILKYFQYDNFLITLDNDLFLTGSNFPWMLDDRIPPGNFYGRNYSYVTSSDGIFSTSSFPVPNGWLTGISGTADNNEWPTQGMSLGPNDILPVYPLLDDIYSEKVYDEIPKTDMTLVPFKGSKMIGFRPGLRGTEVHGKWKLMIGNNADYDGSVGMTGSIRDGWWFRQFRLEFLIDQGEDVRGGSYHSKRRRFNKHSNVRIKKGKNLIEVMSGSSSWDIGTNHILVEQPEDYGRSIGIVDTTDSTDFAVFSRLTGSLVDTLSGSGQLEQVKSTYLNNEFGTPYIPISSGSAEQSTFNILIEDTKNTIAQILNPTSIIPWDNTLRAYLSRENIFQTARDAILEKNKV